MVKPGRPYGGRSVVERRASRRSRLLDAGFELFGTVGFAKTTIPMLCTESGVTARHFYEEFSSREALMRALFDDLSERGHKIVGQALHATDLPVNERVMASNRAYYRFFTEDPRRARIYAIECLGVSAKFEVHRRAVRERSIRQLTRAAEWPQSAGIAPDLDSRLIAVGLSSAAVAVLAEWVLAERKPSVEKMAETLTLFWMRTLRLDRVTAS